MIREDHNMKIQFLNGGLANQVFQYLFTKYYSLSHNGDIMYLDDSYFALNTVHNGYELERVFSLHPPMLSDCLDDDVWDFCLQNRLAGKSIPQILNEIGIPFVMMAEFDNYKSFNPFNGEVILLPSKEYLPEIQDYPKDTYYHGYWVHSGWFHRYEDIFLKELAFPPLVSPKNCDIMEQIHTRHSLAVHIRRGDYVSLGWSYPADTCRQIVQDFISLYSCDWDLFVFSDDIGWCMANSNDLGFTAFHSVTYVEGNVNGNNYIDLQLMSQCKGMILSNSAFSYLAALLNPHKDCLFNPTPRPL